MNVLVNFISNKVNVWCVYIGRASDKFVGGIVGILLTIAVGGMVVLYFNKNRILPGMK